MTPPLTIAHYMPMKALTAFRTGRICDITNEVGSTVYHDVYYEYLGTGFPGSAINHKLEQSLKIPSIKVVLFNRVNLITLRMLLIETDNTATYVDADGNTQTFQRRWVIDQIDTIKPITVLTLRSATNT
jgi:hypothetical protein